LPARVGRGHGGICTTVPGGTIVVVSRFARSTASVLQP
jgi:hypothetical protein